MTNSNASAHIRDILIILQVWSAVAVMRWANMWVIALLMQIKHFTFSHKVTLSLRFIKDNFSRWKLRWRRRCDDEYSSRSFHHHHHQHNIFLAMAAKISSCKPVCAFRQKFLSSSRRRQMSTAAKKSWRIFRKRSGKYKTRFIFPSSEHYLICQSSTLRSSLLQQFFTFPSS